MHRYFSNAKKVKKKSNRRGYVFFYYKLWLRVWQIYVPLSLSLYRLFLLNLCVAWEGGEEAALIETD